MRERLQVSPKLLWSQQDRRGTVLAMLKQSSTQLTTWRASGLEAISFRQWQPLEGKELMKCSNLLLIQTIRKQISARFPRLFHF